MTLPQLEQRISSLEKAVKRLQIQLSRHPDGMVPADSESGISGEDEIIPDAEYPMVLDVPSKQVIHCKGKLRWIRPDSEGLALSDADWASLQLEEDDD